jgi:hypothetical protein
MSQLTRIEFFVDDKNVGAIQRELIKYKVINLTSTPVVNASVSPEGRAVAETGGTTFEMISRAISASMKTEFTSDEIRQYVVAVGKAPTTASAVITELMQQRVLKRKGRGVYTLITKKGK